MRFGIDEILLHRPPMQFLDAVVDVTACGVIAEKTFHADDYGASDGVVCEAALIECMAQAVAAHQGHTAIELGIAPSPGMLVGVRDAVFHAPVCCGVPLRVRAEVKHRVGEFAIAACEVMEGERVCASATLKFYVPGPAS